MRVTVIIMRVTVIIMRVMVYHHACNGYHNISDGNHHACNGYDHASDGWLSSMANSTLHRTGKKYRVWQGYTNHILLNTGVFQNFFPHPQVKLVKLQYFRIKGRLPIQI